MCSAIHAAVDAGYRLIDTAYLYQTEEGVGEGLQQCIEQGKIRREDIFVTTKLPFTAHRQEDVEKIVEMQLKALKLNYVDLYLIHCPCAIKHKEDGFAPLIEDGRFAVDDVDYMETWGALEKLHKIGKLRAIGVSNFNEDQLKRICHNAEIKPHNLQIEIHAFMQQLKLCEYCQANEITVTAYAPIGSPGRKTFNPNGYWPEGNPLEDPVVISIAQRHNKTPAQVLLRNLVQRGIAVIPKSTNANHIRENIDIFDFTLVDEEMQQIKQINKDRRLFVFDYMAHHPYYPMTEQDRSKFGKVAFDSF